MPLSHISIPVGDHYAELRDFYKAVLKPLGYEIFIEGKEYCGFGTPETGPDFWLGGGAKGGAGLERYNGKLEDRVAPVHVAFAANTREQVEEWYANALQCGATDNGKPGLRSEYSHGYFAAFVLDPHGNNIEAVNLTYD